MQDKDIQALGALAEAATPGPWAAFTDDAANHTNIVAFVPRTDCVFSLPGHDKREPNVEFIAAANPAAILSLISRIEQQAARIAELEADKEGWRKAAIGAAKDSQANVLPPFAAPAGQHVAGRSAKLAEALAAQLHQAWSGELPELPPNIAHVTRRIRRYESDVPAQLVLEHFATDYARKAIGEAVVGVRNAALEEAAKVAGSYRMIGAGTIAAAIRSLASNPASPEKD